MVLKLYACKMYACVEQYKNSNLPAVTLPIGLRVSGHVTLYAQRKSCTNFAIGSSSC